jgi:DNA mismatch repair protein MutS
MISLFNFAVLLLLSGRLDFVTRQALDITISDQDRVGQRPAPETDLSGPHVAIVAFIRKPEREVQAMTFQSILFERNDDRIRAERAEAPPCLRDLNLDQIIDAITASKQAYDLKPFFHTPLHDIGAITYRHEVFKDLESSVVLQHIKTFAKGMLAMREHLTAANKLSYKHQKQSWFLDAVGVYCDTVNSLAHNLSSAEMESRGLSAFRDYLINYTESTGFTALVEETQKLKTDLCAIKYCILIKGDTFKVRKYDSEIDYSGDVEETFAKFKQGAVKDYRLKFSEMPDLNHVEAKVLEFVALLYPEIFSRLNEFSAKHVDYLDNAIAAFDREIQFYIAYLEHVERLKQAGLKFCYPRISTTSKEACNYEGFDLALAHKLVSQDSPIVRNDFYLEGNERIFVVSGPNQGGKTTFSRTFGQLHYLTSIGCMVPGRAARLFLCDQIFTHFEREEDIMSLRGKLQDDLVRIHDILNQASSNSIIIMNEIFTSTTLQDATFLSEKVMEKVLQLGALCVWITFIEELASLDEQIVSMVSTVVPTNPTMRTYKVIRQPADGLSYALSIAEKYGLTYAQLKERLKS